MRAARIAAVLFALTTIAAPAALACPAGTYTYAGVAGYVPVSGVGATVTPSLRGFDVLEGHVAGWVGVGGPGEGPGGSDEWIQAGLSSFPLWNGYDVYYEVARPGTPPTYHRVLANVAGGVATRLAVLEMHRRPTWWRIWLDGKPVSPPIHLPASHDRWLPVVTAESWDGGTGACNAFYYSFASLRVARRPGGVWRPLQRTQSIDNANTSVRVRRSPERVEAAGGRIGLRALAATGR